MSHHRVRIVRVAGNDVEVHDGAHIHYINLLDLGWLHHSPFEMALMSALIKFRQGPAVDTATAVLHIGPGFQFTTELEQRHSTSDIVGYVYRSKHYCPQDILRAFHDSPTGRPPISEMTIEQHLDVLARMHGLNRAGDVDNSEFPAVVFRADIDIPLNSTGESMEYRMHRCEICGDMLG